MITEEMRELAHNNMTPQEKTQVSILQLLDKYTSFEAIELLYRTIFDISNNVLNRGTLENRPTKREVQQALKRANKDILRALK